MGETLADALIETIEPEHVGPIVIEVPHAGLAIDEDAGRFTKIPPEARERNAVLADSDIGSDLVWMGSEAHGIPRVVARASRYVIDLNTEPRLPTPYEEKMPEELRVMRVRSQCGIDWRADAVPTREIKRRIAEIFEPYHATVANALERARARHGGALLLSSHTFPDPRGDIADVVLGTRHGASASEAMRDTISSVVRVHGFSVAVETPFAGGLSTVRHARPNEGVGVIQIEIAKRIVSRSRGEPWALEIDPRGVERARAMLIDAAAAARELLERDARALLRIDK